MTTGNAGNDDPLIWESFLWGLLSAVSLNIGSVIGVTCLPRKKIRAILMSFGGGALLFALSIELFGHVLHKSDEDNDKAPVVCMEGSAVLGGCFFAALNRILNAYGADARKFSTTKGRLARLRALLLRNLAGRLLKIPLFSVLSVREVRDLIQAAMYKERFNAGDTIISAETRDCGIYFIISGFVKVYMFEDDKDYDSYMMPQCRQSIPEETAHIWELGPDQIFGDMTVLAGTYIRTVAIAEQTTKVLVLPGHELTRLIDGSEKVRNAVYVRTLERLREIDVLRNIPKSALATLTTHSHMESFQPGERVFAGVVDERTAIICVVLGSVEVHDELTQMRTTIHANNLMCTEHFLSGKTGSPFTAIALEPTSVLLLERRDLDKVATASESRTSLTSLSAIAEDIVPGQGVKDKSSSCLSLQAKAPATPTIVSTNGVVKVEDDRVVVSASYKQAQDMQKDVELPGQAFMEGVPTSEGTVRSTEIVVRRSSKGSSVPSAAVLTEESRVFEAIGSTLGWDSQGEAFSVTPMKTPTQRKIPHLYHGRSDDDLGLLITDEDMEEHRGPSVVVPPSPGERASQAVGSMMRRFSRQGSQPGQSPRLISPSGVTPTTTSPISIIVAEEQFNPLTSQKWSSEASQWEPPLRTSSKNSSQGRLSSKMVVVGAKDDILGRKPKDSRDQEERGPQTVIICEPDDTNRDSFNALPYVGQSTLKDAADQAHEQTKPAHAQGSLEHGGGGHGGGGYHAAIMVWLGILIDAVPESLVIGILINKAVAEGTNTTAAALPFVIGVFLSNLPESMSSSGSMKAHGMRMTTILLMWLTITVLTACGAALGAVLFPPSSSKENSTQMIVSAVEGIAAGAMLTMIAQTMMPEAFEQGGDVVGLSTLAGFLTAVAVKLIPTGDSHRRLGSLL